MKIVHILKAGQALCGLDGTPDQWPANHYWVDEYHVKDATCEGCLASVPKLKAAHIRGRR
jgi:uncharacterized protein (DUF169 family)